MSALVLCASAAAAQSFTNLHSDRAVSGQPVVAPMQSSGTVQDPVYRQQNSLLDRTVSVQSQPTVGRFDKQGSSVSTGRTGGVVSRSGATGGSAANPFSTGHSSSSRFTPFSSTSPGGSTLEGSQGSGLDVGDGDLMPGQLVPIGKALLPLLLMLIGYTAYRAWRRKAKGE